MLPYKCKLLLKVSMQKLLGNRTKLVNDERFNKILFRIMFGRKADFSNPKSFNEFICARKLYDDAFELWPYTDKYEARNYVEETVGKQYLNECYGVYEDPRDIPFEQLPERYALRGTHGSGYNVIVTDRHNLDQKQVVRKFQKWLKRNYYHRCRERNYYKIKPRVMCDKYLECTTADGLPELKIFCFGGKAKFIGYNLCLHGKTYTNMYDADWNYLNVQKGYGNFDNCMIPENRDEIIAVAEKLAAPFEFVRVDLYNVDNRIIFSELTFFSGGGMVPFDPPESDIQFGEYFNGANPKTFRENRQGIQS